MFRTASYSNASMTCRISLSGNVHRRSSFHGVHLYQTRGSQRHTCGQQTCREKLPARQKQSWPCESMASERSSHAETSATPSAREQDTRQGLSDQQQLAPNVWAYKPFWCQPWTIMGTGVAVVSFVNLVSHGSTLWTVLAGLPISAWWFLFLIVYPAQYREYILEQQKLQQED